MQNSKGETIDHLRRAHEMEEDMASILIDLCKAGSQDLSPEINSRLSKTLRIIKNDTLKHKSILNGILQELTGETA